MSQITHGIRAIFSHPKIYDGFQNLLGASDIRRELVAKHIQPRPGMKILDIGCGTAEILDFLPPDIEYWGFDISQPYIDAAARRFGRRGRFHCQILDATQVARLPTFDVAIAFGVLHHLDDADAVGLFDVAHRALAPSGRLITMDPCLIDQQNPVARFLVSRDRGQNVRTPARYCELPGSHFASIEGRVRYRSRIPYTEWVMECRR